MRKKILVYGYKKLNLGDDLFFSILFKRYPKEKFIFLGKKEYKKIFKDHKNVKVISPYSPTDLLFSFFDKIFNKNKETILGRKAKCKVLITGSGFSEHSHDQFKKMPINDNKLFIIGANFGPYKTEEFLKLSTDYFKSCADVCFRDSQSYALFSQLKNIRTAPDIVFDIKTYYKDLPKNVDFIIDSDLNSKKYAVISLISFNKRAKKPDIQKNYISGINKIAKFLISKGLKIVFFSFCQAEGDNESVQEIIKDDFIKNNSYHYSYYGNILEALSILDNSQTIVATRFHAMVLGFAMDKKVLPIIYDQKMTNVLNDLQYEYIYHANTIAELSKLSMEKWYDAYNTLDFSKIAIESKKQFQELDVFLS